MIKLINKITKKIQNHMMTRQDFAKIPPIPINRDVMPRLIKVAKLLRKPLLTHLEVAIVSFWENGKKLSYRINGNTRIEIWENHQGTHIDPDLVPSQLIVTEYTVPDRKAAEQLYHSIDSSDSAESGAEKITGIFSKLGLQFNTSKLAKGLITKVLEFASYNRLSNRGNKQISTSSRENVIKDFRDELVMLDSVAIGRKNPRFNLNAMWCLALMALKRYSNNEAQANKVMRGLERIKNNKQNTHDKTWDGITHILQEWTSGPDNGELKGVQGSSCGTTFPKQLDFLLFHFKNYMDDVQEKPGAWSRKTQRKNSKHKGNYYFKTWYR